MQHMLDMLLPPPSEPLPPKQQQQPAEITMSLAAARSDPNWTAADPASPPRLASEAAVGTTLPRPAVTRESPVGHAADHHPQAVSPYTPPTAVAAPAIDSSSPAVLTGEDVPDTPIPGPHAIASTADSAATFEASASSAPAAGALLSESSARTSNAVVAHAASIAVIVAPSGRDGQQAAVCFPTPPLAPVSSADNCRHSSVKETSAPQRPSSLGGAQPQSLGPTAASAPPSASRSAAPESMLSISRSPSNCSQMCANAHHNLSPTAVSQAEQVQQSLAGAQQLAERDQAPSTASLDGQVETAADAEHEEEQQVPGSSSQEGIAGKLEESSTSSKQDNQQGDLLCKDEEQPQGEQESSQLPQEEEDEQLPEGTAPLLPLLSSAAADQEGVQQRRVEGTQMDRSAHDTSSVSLNEAMPNAKGKPGFLAKTVFCAVFSPILVPVLAVGGCLQIYDALSVQRNLWKYAI